MARCRPPASAASGLALSWLCVLLRVQLAQGLKAIAGQKLLSGPPQNPRAFLHFLFLLDDVLPHHEVWRRFFADAPAGSWAVWAHCSNEACAKHPSLASLPVHVVPHVPSQWGFDLVTPEVRLLRSATESGPEGSAPALEKFVLLSNSTLPLKPYAVVAEALSRSSDSEFCLQNSAWWPQGTINKQRYAMPKHQQWAVLNRSDAQSLIQRWQGPLTLKSGWDVTLPDGSVVPRIEFEDKGQVADEHVFSMTRGVVALRTTSATELEHFRSEHSTCRTYLAAVDDIRRVKKGTPAVAKFSPYANVTWQLLRDTGTEYFDQVPVTVRPVNIKRAGRQFMEALRSSPYLFARKFAGAVPEDWADYFFAT